MLTQDDLARIRIIIREELKRNEKNRYTSLFNSNENNKQCEECDDDDDITYQTTCEVEDLC